MAKSTMFSVIPKPLLVVWITGMVLGACGATAVVWAVVHFALKHW